MSVGSKLSKASSYFFISGFIVGKIQYLPLPFVVAITNLISLGFYLTGYSLWFIASHFHPEHTRKENEWYGFAQFKEQHLYAATLGIIATLISACSIALPVLIVPATWVFLISNIVWTIGEYHKFNNPPNYDPNYSHSYQNSYLSYAITMSAIGLATAVSATLTFLFPAAAVSIILLSTIICLGLGILATDCWLDYTFGDHKKGIPSEHSYKQMQESFGPGLASQASNLPAPCHDTALFKPNEPAPIRQIIDEPASSIQSCTVP